MDAPDVEMTDAAAPAGSLVVENEDSDKPETRSVESDEEEESDDDDDDDDDDDESEAEPEEQEEEDDGEEAYGAQRLDELECLCGEIKQQRLINKICLKCAGLPEELKIRLILGPKNCTECKKLYYGDAPVERIFRAMVAQQQVVVKGEYCSLKCMTLNTGKHELKDSAPA